MGIMTVCSCSNKIPQTGCFTSRNVFLTVLKAGKSKIKVLADSVSVEGLYLLGVPSHSVHGGRGAL